MEEAEWNSELREEFARAYAKDKFGIDIPVPTQEEKLLQEGLDEDPEFRRQYRQGLLEKLDGESTGEPDELDRTLTQARQLAELRELLGGRSGGWQGLLKETGPALVELLQAVVEARSGSTTMDNASATNDRLPAQEPHRPEPSPGSTDRVAEEGRVSPEIASSSSSPATAPQPNPLEPPQSQPPAEPEASSQEKEPIDFKSLLSKLDWGELEKGVHGDPMDFMQLVEDSSTGDDDGLQALAQLFKDNEPAKILDVLSHALDSLAVAPGKGERYEIAVVVLKHLTVAEAGREWLVKAHAAARSAIDVVVGYGEEKFQEDAGIRTDSSATPRSFDAPTG